MVDRFLRYIEAERRYSPLTVSNYRRDIERFVAWWEQGRGVPFDPNEVRAEALSDWMEQRSREGNLKGNSLNRELSSLRSFFRYLRREGLIERDVLHLIRPAKSPKLLPAYLPKQRMRSVIEGCIDSSEAAAVEEDAVRAFELCRDTLIILLLYGCGLRLAELVGADRADLECDCTLLRVHGKGNKERLVPLPDFVREKIIGYLDTISRQQICKIEEKALFLTSRGVRISRSAVYRLVRRVLGEADVQGKRSPHVLRHTFATHLMQGGADLRAIQELMGHASLRSTQVYTHNSIGHLQQIYAEAHPRQRKGNRDKGGE